MNTTLLKLALILAPVVLTADTVTLRDGTRHHGTFVSGTSRTVTLVDENGSRRNFELREVQEVAFGTASTPQAAASANRTRTESVSDQIRLLEKIQEDLTIAMEQSKLSYRQRDMLQDSRDVIGTAISNHQDNRTVDTRAVRTALDNIRYVANANVLRESDRRALLASVDELRRLNVDYRPAAGSTRPRAR